MRAGRLAAHPSGPWILLTCLLWRLESNFLRVVFSYLPSPCWYVFRQLSTSTLVYGQILARPLDIDVDVAFSVHTAREKELESEDRQQDNHNNGHRSYTATRIFSHFSPLLGMDAGIKHDVR